MTDDSTMKDMKHEQISG